MSFTTSQFTQYIIDVIVIILAGIGEYLHLLPSGTFSALMFIVIGHLFGSVPTTLSTQATLANTQATIANTQATSTVQEVATKQG